MSNRNRTAIHIQLGVVKAKITRTGDSLCCEGFVNLNTIDLIELQSTSFQYGADCRNGTDPHDLGRNSDRDPSQKSCQRFLVVSFHETTRSHQSGNSSVNDGRTVSPRLHSAECWGQLRQNL